MGTLARTALGRRDLRREAIAFVSRSRFSSDFRSNGGGIAACLLGLGSASFFGGAGSLGAGAGAFRVVALDDTASGRLGAVALGGHVTDHLKCSSAWLWRRSIRRF